nr:unnamed protein product [Callosobruchus analis]
MMREFEDVAMENESTHMEEIKKQKCAISKLSEEMAHLRQINDQLQLKSDAHLEDIKKLNKNFDELMDINRNMVNTIEVLEQENKMYATQLNENKKSHKENNSDDLRLIDLIASPESKNREDRDVSVSDNCDSEKPIQECVRVENTIGLVLSGSDCTRKLCIIADEEGRNMSTVLNDELTSAIDLTNSLDMLTPGAKENHSNMPNNFLDLNNPQRMSL